MEDYDLIVIGAGPGGLAAATSALRLKKRVALIERDTAGGTCLARGCIPTKALHSSAELFRHILDAEFLGIDSPDPIPDLSYMRARKEQIVSLFSHAIEGNLVRQGGAYIHGTARFLSPSRVLVQSADGDRELSAPAILIATGSVSAPPFSLPDEPRVIDSTAFLELEEFPDRLVVLGGGVMGCEFASLAAEFGIQVTILERLDDLLSNRVDDDVRQILRKRLKDLGVTIRTSIALAEVTADEAGVHVRCENETFDSDLLLVTTGHRPNTDGLDLHAAGVETDKRGFIEVDALGRTSSQGVYAIGDVASGSRSLAHTATAEGIAVVSTIFGEPSVRSDLVPFCIFTTPEIAAVGLTEEEARAKGISILTGKSFFLANGKAAAEGDTNGFVKMIAEAGTGRIIGAEAVGGNASELISTATIAIQCGMTAQALAAVIIPHPTRSEAWTAAAATVR